MLTTIKITRLIIEDVESMEIDEALEFIKDEVSERTITVRTYDGHRYEITLRATSPEKLELIKESKDSWLMPKVYKGNKEE
jgi:pyruvate-formate lyase-activating enzyme